MSWDYNVAGDAWPSIRSLDVEVQEAVFDGLEELCDDGDGRYAHGEQTERLFPVIDGVMHPLTLLILSNPQRRLITLMDVQED